jgi:hypothetical protein
VVELALKTLADFGVEVGSVRVLSGDYLDKHNLMGQHYGVISAISREGPAVISEQAKKNLDEKFKADIEAGAAVLGGHQFLAKEPGFNAFSLSVLNDNLGTTRLAGGTKINLALIITIFQILGESNSCLNSIGTYAMKIKVLGKPVIILNPFHAYQLGESSLRNLSSCIYCCSDSNFCARVVFIQSPTPPRVTRSSSSRPAPPSRGRISARSSPAPPTPRMLLRVPSATCSSSTYVTSLTHCSLLRVFAFSLPLLRTLFLYDASFAAFFLNIIVDNLLPQSA